MPFAPREEALRELALSPPRVRSDQHLKIVYSTNNNGRAKIESHANTYGQSHWMQAVDLSRLLAECNGVASGVRPPSRLLD